MTAAVLRRFGSPLELEERPFPPALPGTVVVRLEACGLCHMDLQIAAGSWSRLPQLPLVPGHEAVGRVAEVGAGVRHLRPGDRVAIGWLASACGRCRACLSGQEQLCPSRRHTGLDVDGGFATAIRVDAGMAVPVPVGVDPLDAACLTCAGAAALRAVRLAEVGVGTSVAVFGVGGVGHLAIQYARNAGATVTAVDTVPAKLTLARELGARLSLDASSAEPATVLRRRGGVDCALLTTDAPVAAEAALSALRPGGRLVVVATPAKAELALPVADLVAGGLDAIGSTGPNRLDIAEVLDLHLAGRTRVVHQARFLPHVNEALAELEGGAAPAQLVLELR